MMMDWKSSRSSFKSASRDDDWPAMATLRARERTADLEDVREGPRHIRTVSIVTWRYKDEGASDLTYPASSREISFPRSALPAGFARRPCVADRKLSLRWARATCRSHRKGIPRRISEARMKSERNNGYLRTTTIVAEQPADLSGSGPIGQDGAPTANPLQVRGSWLSSVLQNTMCSLRIFINIS